MTKKRKVKFILVALATSFIILSCENAQGYTRYNPNYKILEGEEAYGEYSLGRVYIGNEDYINSLVQEENNVYVLDEREEGQNIKILNSYKITNRNYQTDILNIINDYEEKYPTEWDRSIETMITEWNAHNFCYNIHYRRDHTTDVDFENSEEEFYQRKILKRIFK
jgi:hypothetical protein